MPTGLGDVKDLLCCLKRVGIEARLAGGWGVDALVGRQTREHRDLDVAIPVELVTDAISALGAIGFTITTDWLPVRVELSQHQRHVDIHPLNFRLNGSAWQAGLQDTRFEYPVDAWTKGSIDGLPVSCLTLTMQRRFHSGYQPREVDLHDWRMLDLVEDASVPGTAGAPRMGDGLAGPTQVFDPELP